MIEIGEKGACRRSEQPQCDAHRRNDNSLKTSHPMLLQKTRPSLNRSMELAKKLLAMPRSRTRIDEKPGKLRCWDRRTESSDSSICRKSSIEEAEANSIQTVKINPKDQMAWYRYGLAATKITIAAQD